MLIDASALIAMLLDEEKARSLAGRLQDSAQRVTTLPCLTETVAVVARRRDLAPETVEALVARFLDLMGIRIVSLPPVLSAPAAAALQRFGADPAFGAAQALTYAAARYYRLPLLFDGAVFRAAEGDAG